MAAIIDPPQTRKAIVYLYGPFTESRPWDGSFDNPVATGCIVSPAQPLTWGKVYKPMKRSITFHCKFRLMKPRKTTFKTIKRDCAKRNR